MSDVSSLRGTSVVVLGDVMLDEFIWGNVERISPEAPVPVVEVRDRSHAPGGAANAAAGVVALEGRALLAGVVGEDAAASSLREALTDAHVGADGLIADAGRPTTTKTRVIAHAQQVVRTDSESRAALADETETALIAWLGAALGQSAALVISDYGKGVVSDAVASAAIGAAREAGKPIVVDSKGIHYAKYHGATVITPNVHDAAKAANLHIESDEDLGEAARRLSDLCGGAGILITRGAAGMTLYSDGDPLHIPTEAREVYDVTGAGDTVVAVLAVALGAGVSLRDAVRLANAAAGIVVGKVGTSTVSLTELEERLR